MPMMCIAMTPKADAEKRAIHERVALENEAAAQAVTARIEYVMGLLAENPGMGRKVSGGRLRRFPVKPYPYLIYYEAMPDVLRIIRIRHSAQYRKAMHEPAPPFAR